MKLLILNENYPHSENLMGNGFVHVRAKEYARRHEVLVFTYFHEPREIQYEGISIRSFDKIENLIQAVRQYQPERILIHFYQSWMLEHLIRKTEIPVIIWVHGFEAQGWYRRLFNFSWYSPVFLDFVRKNFIQQKNFNRLVHFANQNNRIHFVLVSHWIRKVAEVDSMARIYCKHIIPNPIDTNLFRYRQKEKKDRLKILLLRSFASRKYANDISVEAILRLSTRPFFRELEFSVIGQGSLFESLTGPLRQFSNVFLQPTGVLQRKIPELHKDHGIFLCPTRQDTHGVSMCEAMSSGLVPIASKNSAIPEFVTDQETGFLTRGSSGVAAAIERLYHDPSLFLGMSRAASESIRQKCGIDKVLPLELQLIQENP